MFSSIFWPPDLLQHRKSCTSVGRHYTESITFLANAGARISTRPETSPAYNLRLYPLTIERSALLTQITMDERRELEIVETAYEEERDRVEEEWKRGRDMIRKRLLEGIEERRRRAREEKDGEGNVGGLCILCLRPRGLTSDPPSFFRCKPGFTIKTAYNTETPEPTWRITSTFASDDDSERHRPWSGNSRATCQSTLTVNRRIAFPVPPPSHINAATLWQHWCHDRW